MKPTFATALFLGLITTISSCAGSGDGLPELDVTITVGAVEPDVQVVVDTGSEDTAGPLDDAQVEDGLAADALADASSDAAIGETVEGLDGVAEFDSAWEEAAAFFGLDAVHTVHITLEEEQVDSLWEQPYVWVPGDVIVDGEVHEQIGVRLKGQLGSFRDLEQKAAFLLKFNHFEAGNDLHGVKKLALNNLVQDASLVHELLAYTLFRAMGVPAPRVTYARVLVNWELYGLYLMVESPNNEHFLEHWFEGHDSGSLYEGEYGQDLFVDAVPGFDQDEGEDTEKLDLYALVQALDWMDMGGDVPVQLGELIDLDRYLAFAATEIAIGHWDGYAWTRNNFYLYQPTAESRWAFMPWGTDQTFADHLDPFGGQGRIEQICMTSPPCRDLLGAAFYETLDQMAALDLGALALQAHSLVWETALEDPRKEVDTDQMATALGNTIAYLTTRPLSVVDGLACLDPEYGDGDEDGFTSCFGQDCDDGEPSVYPGAAETCNFRDDDCDGEIDEVLEGEESCPTCETILTDDVGSVLLCRLALNYADAHAACLARGADLVSIHSQEQQEAIAGAAYASYGGHIWIGLNDLETEGTFAWTDGSPVDYQNWNDNEPNDHGSGEDCGHLYEGNGNKWNDLPCHHPAGYLCRVPDLSLP